MKQPDWLERVLSIRENTPYQGVLAIAGDHQQDIKGEALFHIENGELKFRFFIDDEEPRDAGPKACAASSDTNMPLELRIPSRDFTYPAVITMNPAGGVINRRRWIEGCIATNCYGIPNKTSEVARIWFRGIPTGWHGPEHWTHYQGITHERIRFEDSGEAVLPDSGSLSVAALSGFTLRAGSWTTTIREIPIEDRPEVDITYICDITNDDGGMTSELAKEFIDENLFPFLSFVFGMNIRYDQIMGGGGWAIVPRRQTTETKTLNQNWFLRSRGDVELSGLFYAYCNLPPDVKTHWQRVIDQYAMSEEIMGTLRATAIAASVSFASLEGLTRSFISTYSQKREWLNKDLSLKRGKGIIKAIEMVAKEELGAHEEVFRQASSEIYQVRNHTMHLDLVADDNAENAYHRWNSSQALIEILMLAKIGLTEIPNRTALGTYNIMGQDMFEDIRKEELDFRQTEVQPEAGNPE